MEINNNKMTEEEKYLFEELRKKRQNQALAFDFSMEGIKKGTEDIYPDTAHFIYELLQNADDCYATEVYFILKKDSLVFKHNGSEHFNITPDREDVKPYGHINSITAYRSTKTDKIGKFGIGFKSVYQYTDIPEIYDDVFKFGITDRMIPYIIDHDYVSYDHKYESRKPGETLFYIKFTDPKTQSREIRAKLDGLEDPVLFLPNINKITWVEPGDGKVHTYSRKQETLLKKQGYNWLLYRNNKRRQIRFAVHFRKKSEN